MKDRTLAEIDKIEESLRNLCLDPGCERYRDILFMWYVEKKGKEDIAAELRYSHRQSVYELKNIAIKKFAVSLFGVAALEAI